MMRAWIGMLSLLVVLTFAGQAGAETRYALIVTGASGGEKYAAQMKQWRAGLQTALVERHGFDAKNVRVLTDEAESGGTTGSAANVKAALTEVRKSATKDDLVVVIL